MGLGVQPIDHWRAQARAIVEMLNESVALCRLDGDSVAVVKTFAPSQALQVVLSPAITHIELLTSSAGEAVLSTLDPAAATTMIPRTLDKATRPRLEVAVSAARHVSYATDQNQQFAGVSSITSPFAVGDKQDAFAVVALSERLRTELSTLVVSFQAQRLTSTT